MEAQSKRVLNLLQQAPYIKSDVIVYGLHIPRASARIYDLKMMGHNIEGFWQELNGKRKYCYRLKK